MVPDFPMAAKASRGIFQYVQKSEFRGSVLQKRSVSRGPSWVFHGFSMGPTVHLVLALSISEVYRGWLDWQSKRREGIVSWVTRASWNLFQVASSATSAVKRNNPTASQA